PHGVATGDFNGDGQPDLGVANAYYGGVSILLGNGDGTFRPPVGYATSFSSASVVVDDFDHDGRLDLAVSSGGFYGTTVSVLLGNGDGSFQGAVNYYAGSGVNSVTTADLNGDGFPDLVTANVNSFTLALLYNAADWPPNAGGGSPTLPPRNHNI